MAEPVVPSNHPADRQETAVHPDPDRHDTALLPDPLAAAGHPSVPGPVATGRRRPDLVALVAGVVFCLVAVLGLVGTSLPTWVFGGGLVAVVLVVLGVGLLISELRRR